MSDATKQPDRRRPFKRVDNQAFIPAKVLDGDGVACGCHIQKDIGDIDAKLDAFIKDSRNKLLGQVLSDLIDTVRTALHPSKLAKILVDAIRNKLGTVPAKIFEVPLTILGGIGEILFAPVNKIIDPIVGIIERGAQAFVRLFATPLLLRAVRFVPQWVPVTPRASDNAVDRSQVIEVEGVCVRSYGNPIDVPFANWHAWFAWNVQVQLEPQYALALAPVADPPNTSGAAAGETSVIKSGSFEIQGDAGALFASDAAYRKGFSADDMPFNDGPWITPGGKQVLGETDFTTDFFWPMPGMFVWASGRHVYDCSRVTHKAGATGGRDSEASPPLMCAMMQPARAMATARFQAVVFPENGSLAVPAIEFLFIACKRGGYIAHEKLADEDYVFIIDLPPGPAAASPFPIAHTDEVPHNTITLRPRLLRKLKFLLPIGSSSEPPIIELLPPATPRAAPQQVRVKIPQGVLGGAAYGFKLSLGWHDPTREFARQVLVYELDVRSLTMRLTDRENPAQKLRNLVGADREKALRDAIMAELEQIEVDVPFLKEPIHPLKIPALRALVEPVVTKMLDTLLDIIVKLMPTETEEEWLLRIGVNGAWATFFLKPKIQRIEPAPGQPSTNKPVDFNASGLVFRGSLAIGDELSMALHGSEFDPVGDIMRAPLDGRTLKLPNGAKVPWANIVSPNTKKEFDDILFDVMHRLMFDTTGGVSRLSLGFDNSPLGLIDPDPVGNRGTQPQNNPMVAQAVIDPAVRLTRSATFARALSPEMVLVEDGAGGRPDYRVVYELKITHQIADSNPA